MFIDDCERVVVLFDEACEVDVVESSNHLMPQNCSLEFVEGIGCIYGTCVRWFVVLDAQ